MGRRCTCRGAGMSGRRIEARPSGGGLPLWLACTARPPQRKLARATACKQAPPPFQPSWPPSTTTPQNQNLREMVYLLNGTPRAVDASLAVPGERLQLGSPWLAALDQSHDRAEQRGGACACACCHHARQPWYRQAAPPAQPAAASPFLTLPAPRLPGAGPARGSQSTYDRALRCMFGTDDSELAGKQRSPDGLL